jgi:hypothetical protein
VLLIIIWDMVLTNLNTMQSLSPDIICWTNGATD